MPPKNHGDHQADHVTDELEHAQPPGRGAELYAAVRAADDAIKAVWAEWDRLPRNPGGWIDREVRDAFDARLHQAQDAREEAASQCWGYFGGRGTYTGPGHAPAEELAAWWLLYPNHRPSPSP